MPVGAANADTYDVFGTFNNGANLTGTIGLNDGELLAVDLSAAGSIPGDNATHWNGTLVCDQTSCAPGQTSYDYILASVIVVSETYNVSTSVYDFFFNGGASYAYLNLDFNLAEGVITSGGDYDPACGPPSTCPSGASLTGGTVVGTTPIPAALPLFATGLGALGLLGWRRKRKNPRSAGWSPNT